MSRVVQETIDDPETSPAVRNVMRVFHATLKMRNVREALRDLLADIDDVAAGKLPEISAATLAKARQALLDNPM